MVGNIKQQKELTMNMAVILHALWLPVVPHKAVAEVSE